MDLAHNDSFDTFDSNSEVKSSSLYGRQIMSSGSGDVIIPNVSHKRSKVWIFIVVAIILAVILGVISVFFANRETSNGGNDTDLVSVTSVEAYDVLWKVYYEGDYQDLLESYDFIIGFSPDLKISEYDLFFPVDESNLKILNEYVDTSSAKYNELTGLKISDSGDNDIMFRNIVTSMGVALDTMKKNIAVLNEFYEAFIAPIYSIESVPAYCGENDIIVRLLNGDFGAVAEEYYALYCDAVKYFNEYGLDVNFEDVKKAMNDVVNSATAMLSEVMVDVDIDPDEIENVMKVLSQ